MSWHVDEADADTFVQRQVREPEVDRETAASLLFEAVGVDAGERLHQRRLAVINVPGGGYDAHERNAAIR